MRNKRTIVVVGFCSSLAIVTLVVAQTPSTCNCGCKDLRDYGYHLGTWDDVDGRYEDANGDPVTDTKCWRLQQSAPYPYGAEIWVQAGLMTQYDKDTGMTIGLADYMGCELECEGSSMNVNQQPGEIQEALSPIPDEDLTFDSDVPLRECDNIPSGWIRDPNSPCNITLPKT